ncbi:MAG: site-2 protease family protein [Planctomycetota bacterium]
MGLSSIRLFRLFGIDVFLHWTWFIAAVFIIPAFHMFDSLVYKIGIFVALFGIVTLHEFGHALACKSVGGKANRIMLWPLGGVAFVQPPQRPGAVLWSIVAGPLVNVVLVPVTLIAYVAVAGSRPRLRVMPRSFWVPWR